MQNDGIFRYISGLTITNMKQIVPKLSGIARWGLATLFAVAVTALALQASEPGKKAADWKLQDVNGKAVSLADFKGKVVILDFWATWCGPCVKEVPGFVELQKQYGPEGVVVVGVSLDDEGPKVVKKFMEKYSVNYPVVMYNNKVIKDYGNIQSIPTTFVIDRDGKIIFKHVGFTEKSVFESQIKSLLKK